MSMTASLMDELELSTLCCPSQRSRLNGGRLLEGAIRIGYPLRLILPNQLVQKDAEFLVYFGIAMLSKNISLLNEPGPT